MYEAKAVPLESEISLGFEEINHGYSKEDAIIEASRCLTCINPTCVRRCPAHLHVPGYMNSVAHGRFQEALKLIYAFFPLPGVCGRVCFHPCMEDCLQYRTPGGEALRIPMIRRAAADFGNLEQLNIKFGFPTGKKVAVIGAGPAGLTCAYHLRRLGHDVVIYERENAPGGQLYYTIPKFRLPKDLILRESEVLTKMGITFKYNADVGTDPAMVDLISSYDAVFIGIGAMKSTKLNIPGESNPSVKEALHFLKDVNEGHVKALSGSIAVVGGGNVAIDVWRTVIRLHPSEMHIIYRRSPKEMPASKGEVKEFIEEVVNHRIELGDMDDGSAKLALFSILEKDGSKIATKVYAHFNTQPTQFIEAGDRITAIEASPMKLVPDPSEPRGKLVLQKDVKFKINVDMALIAAGEKADISSLNMKDISATKWGTVSVNGDLQSSIKKVFAGGDVVNGPASMIEAIRDGKNAAYAIDKFLGR